jgi:hypothetical protein
MSASRKAAAVAVSIPAHLFMCPAYRALYPLCRGLLTELLAVAKRVGTEEPINCSVRTAADMCAVSKSHAGRAMDELEARGFIVSVRRGDRSGRGFGRGRASSWRITCLPFRGEWETCDYNRNYDREHNREVCADRKGETRFLTPEMETEAARGDGREDEEEVAELLAQMDEETVPETVKRRA